MIDRQIESEKAMVEFPGRQNVFFQDFYSLNQKDSSPCVLNLVQMQLVEESQSHSWSS